MKAFVAALIIGIIVLLAPPAQSGAGCVVSAGVDIPADLATAQASSKCLELPAGTFTISPTNGPWLNVTAARMEIKGAGMGETVIQTQGVALTSNLQLIQLHGMGQHVHDLTIAIGTGYTGAFGVYGVDAYNTANYPLIERVEVVGGYSGNGGANGGGITTYHVGATPAQFATIRDNWIHDSPAQGMVINSSYNLILHNRIDHITGTALTHGIYMQGGYNLVDGNYVANVSGYSFHAYKKVPGIDGSGDRWANNTSIDPGVQHMVVSGLNGTDGKPLTRNVTITGNLFRASHPTLGIGTDVPALISGNTFEDVAIGSGGAIAVNAAAVGSVVSDNAIRFLNPVLPPAGIGIRVDAAATVANNTIDMAGLGYGAWLLKPKVTFASNRLINTGTGYAWQKAIAIYSAGVLINGNIVDIPIGTGFDGTVWPAHATDNLIWIGGVLQ